MSDMALSKDEEIAFRGYDEVTEWFNPNDSLEDTFARLNELDRINKVYNVGKMRLKDALSDTKVFYKEYFRMHKITFLDTRRFLGKSFSLIRPIDPFKLPIEYFDSDDIFDGMVVERLIPNEPGLVVFKSINLSNPITEHTPSSYTHELMHTQVDSLMGCVRNFFDAEVLSIFIELVFTYCCNKDERMLGLEDSRRVQEMELMYKILKMFINTGRVDDEYRINLVGDLGKDEATIREEMLENTKYLVSDLKAYNLFITYYYGNDRIRKEMIRDIQRVIDGEITLDDYLSKYEVSISNSQEEKRLLKYFGR